MVSLGDLVGLAGHTLLWGWLILTLPGLRGWTGWRRGLALAGGFGLAWIPLLGTPCLHYFRGQVGDPSLTTLVVVLLSLLAGFGLRNDYTRALPRDLALLLAVLLGIMYAGVLGFLPAVDVYAWGYQPQEMLLGLAILLGYAWWRHCGFGLALLAGLAGFQVQAMLSPNLWDYLADPFLAAAALVRVVWPLPFSCGKTTADFGPVKVPMMLSSVENQQAA